MSREEWMEPAERWAWAEICAGRVANFNEREHNIIASGSSRGWTDLRKLRSEFIRSILFREQYKNLIPVEGIRIAGAWFQDPVDVAYGRLTHQLWLTDCRFEEAVNLQGLVVDGWLAFDGSTFASQSQDPPSLNLEDVKVVGHLSLDDATIAGTTNMDSLEVIHDLYMRSQNAQCIFNNVIMWGARVHDWLVMNDANFRGRLDMFGIEVGQNFYFDRIKAVDVTLKNANIGGEVGTRGADICGELDMYALKVGQNFFMGGGTRISKRVSLALARIGSDLNISGAELANLDLTATRVGGEVRLSAISEPPTKWRDGSYLSLREARVGAVQGLRRDWQDVWPKKLELDGFSYDRLSRIEDGTDAEALGDEVGAYVEWLKRDPSYSPQPYAQLADVFRKAGEAAKAERVLYESRERERRKESGWRRLWLGVLKSTIGYGIGLRYFRALRWVVGLTLFGAILLIISGQGPDGTAHDLKAIVQSLPAKTAYSLDQLLPIVQLDKNFDEVPLEGLIKYYFYIHKLIGWALGSFLIAGLAGLTQK